MHPVRAMPGAHSHAGFSYIEVLLAVLLLSVCLVPMLNAINNAVGTPKAVQDGAQSMACAKIQMERVLAEPYRNLLAAAGSTMTTVSPTYSLAADATCPARNVSIAQYNPASTLNPSPTDTGLLYVSVASVDPGAAPANLLFGFTTLVAR